MIRLILGFFLSALIISSCTHDEKTPDEGTGETDLLVTDSLSMSQIKVQSPGSGPIRMELQITGEVLVDPQRMVSVSFPNPVSFSALTISEGDMVSAGSIMGWFHSDPIYSKSQEFLELKATLPALRQEFYRISQLEKGNLESKSVLEDVTARLQSAETQHNLLKTQLLAWFQPESDLLPDGNTSNKGLPLRTPVSGMVIHSPMSLGTMIPPGEPSFTIVNTKVVRIRAHVPEIYFNSVDKGDSLVVSVPTQQTPILSIVDFVSPLIDETTHTREIIARTDNTDGTLLPGMHAEVTIIRYVSARLRIPDSSLVILGEKTGVFIQTQANSYRLIPVITGSSGSGFTEIISGLDSTNLVVTEGAFLLKSLLRFGEFGE